MYGLLSQLTEINFNCAFYAFTGYVQRRLLCFDYVPLSWCPVSTCTCPHGHYTHAAVEASYDSSV